jgi:dUTP pyrophosphatase
MTSPFVLAVRRLDADLPELRYATSGSAAFDVRSRIDWVIQPSEIAQIPTGVAFDLPEGYEAQIRARSGLATKGITVVNAPGTIDADFRGEIQVILMNLGKTPFHVERSMRIAQVVICPVIQVAFQWVDQLSETERGQGGFGSTGLY